MAAPIRIRPGDGRRLIVVLPYSQERVEKIKTILGRRWHPEEKDWTVPHTEEMVEGLLALFEGEKIEVNPALRPLDTDVVMAVEQELTCAATAPRRKKPIGFTSNGSCDVFLLPRLRKRMMSALTSWR